MRSSSRRLAIGCDQGDHCHSSGSAWPPLRVRLVAGPANQKVSGQSEAGQRWLRVALTGRSDPTGWLVQSTSYR